MATRTLYSNRNRHRLIISTILTHAIVFHEAGIEISTEIRTRVQSVWWNPSTWSRYRWDKSNDANQPKIDEFIFIQGADVRRNPNDFAVQISRSTGYSKSSCVYGNAGGSPIDTGLDARSVNDVLVTFTYDGRTTTLRNSDN